MSEVPRRWLDDEGAPDVMRQQLEQAMAVDPPAFDASAGLARFESALEGAGASGAVAGASTLQLVVLGAVLVGAGGATWLSLSGPTEPIKAPTPAAIF